MRRRCSRALPLAVVLCVVLSAPAFGAAIFVRGVDLTTGWSDVDKSQPSDTYLCWALASSDALAWSGWWGWDAVAHSYISSAADIADVFRAGWPTGPTGTAMHAMEWWMTTQTQTELPGGYTFDTRGLGFYPTEGDYATPYTDRAWGYSEASAGFSQYDNLDYYLSNDVVLIASFHVGASDYGEYDHDVTVWGWDPIAHLIYLTDNDDGMHAIRTYSFSGVPGGQVTILGYENPYTDPINVQIGRLTRLNLNDPFEEPVHPGGGAGVVPEPTTMLLLGTGLSGLLVARRKARKS
jgi:hypothetical protein